MFGGAENATKIDASKPEFHHGFFFFSISPNLTCNMTGETSSKRSPVTSAGKSNVLHLLGNGCIISCDCTGQLMKQDKSSGSSVHAARVEEI